MNYDAVTEQSYFHKNVVAVATAIVVCLAIIVGGYCFHSKLMIDSGYIWVQETRTPSGWVKQK